MQRTPPTRTSAFGRKFPIPRRLSKLVRLAAATMLAVASMVPATLPAFADDVTTNDWQVEPVGDVGVNTNLTTGGTIRFADGDAGVDHVDALIDSLQVILQGSVGPNAVRAATTLTMGAPTAADATLLTPGAFNCVNDTCTNTTVVIDPTPNAVHATNSDLQLIGVKVNNVGVYRLRSVATDADVLGTPLGDNSDNFNIVGMSFLTHADTALAGVQPSAAAQAGVALATQPTVTIIDNIASNAVIDLTLTLRNAGDTANVVPEVARLIRVGGDGGGITCTVTATVSSQCTLTAPALGGDGVGPAAFTSLAIDTPGNYTLRASTADADASVALKAATATSTTITVASAYVALAGDKLVFTTNTTGGTGGAAWPTQPSVQLQRSDGTLVVNNNDLVSINIANTSGVVLPAGAAEITGPSCTARPAGTAANNRDTAPIVCTVRLAGGIAAFAGLAVQDVGTYTLLASTTAPGVTGATSSPFTVTVGAPFEIVSRGITPVGAARTRLVGRPEYRIRDAGGNEIETDNTSTISVALTDVTGNPPTTGAVLSGTTTKTVKKGRATFDDLRVNIIGTYLLRATSSAPVPPRDTTIEIRDYGIEVLATPKTGVTGQPLDPFVVNIVDSQGVVQATQNLVCLRLRVGGVSKNFAYAGVVADQSCIAAVSGTATWAGVTVAAPPGPDRFSVDFRMGAGQAVYTRANEDNNTATVDGNVAGGTAASFVISDRQLIWTSQPGTAEAGKTLDRQPVIIWASGAGVQISNSSDTATISLTKADGAKLSGTGCATDGASCTVTFINGAAVFSNLSVDKAGTYTLSASTTAQDTGGNRPVSRDSASFTVTGAAVPPPGAPGAPPPPGAAAPVPVLPTVTTGPPSTDMAALGAVVAFLRDIPTQFVSWSYLGPSAVVVQLMIPTRQQLAFPTGCWSGPNATAEERAAAVLHGTKPAGTESIHFFVRGTRSYVFDTSTGDYCWFDLMP